EVVREGDLLPLKIVRIERDRHRLGLSLRDAREEGERMGFRFTDGGEVMEVPDDVRKEFEESEGVVVGVRSEAPDEEETVAPTVAVAEVAVPAEPPVTSVVPQYTELRRRRLEDPARQGRPTRQQE